MKLETDADLDVGEFGIATRLVGGPRDLVNGRLPSRPAARWSTGPRSRARAERGRARAARDSRPSRSPAQHYELAAHPITLGRSKDCDIRLGDPNVSRRHAEIRPDGDGWTVVDLGSTNGIEVDGRRVKELALTDGARFTLGTTEVSFSRAAD